MDFGAFLVDLGHFLGVFFADFAGLVDLLGSGPFFDRTPNWRSQDQEPSSGIRQVPTKPAKKWRISFHPLYVGGLWGAAAQTLVT